MTKDRDDPPDHLTFSQRYGYCARVSPGEEDDMI